ncbi:hypothetical protein CP8484711_0493B, partial [Chlamydia psittaci 84-8471/1]
AP